MEEPTKRQGSAKPANRSRLKSADRAPRAGGETGEKLDRRALIVGINDYQGGINDLPSCVNDARAVEDLVRGAYKFSSTRVLLDSDATRANVASELEKLFSKATSDTRLLFYYSGHGSTDSKGNVLEECLVLYDGFFFDDKLVDLAAGAPRSIFTAVLDSCFSGGMDKQLLKTAMRAEGVIERARVKAFVREDPKEFEEHASDQQQFKTAKEFCGSPFLPPLSLANEVLVSAAAGKALILAPPSDEAGQKLLNGLLLSACLETETAAASTPSTDGKSSFTFGLLDALKTLGYRASNNQIVEAVQQKLKRIGFRQTPLIKEPPGSTGMGERSFLTLEQPKRGTPVSVGDRSDEPATSLANALLQIGTGGSTMDAATLVQIITALSKSNQSIQKSKGLGDLLPIVLPLLLKGRDAAQPAGKGLIDILPVVLPLLLKASQPSQEKLFGIDDAILIPALTTIITAAINKGPAPPNEKLFGIDDAILGPLIVSIATSAINR